MTNKSNKLLKHFTNVYCLKKILHEGFKFSDPSSWKDKNDSACIAMNEHKSDSPIIRVICFCRGIDTLHHWSYYGKYTNNKLNKQDYYDANIKCFISFDCEKVEQYVEQLGEQYRMINCKYYSNEKLKVEMDELKKVENEYQLLALKRNKYKVDDECRIIYKGENEPAPLDLCGCIKGIMIDGSISRKDYKKVKLFIENLLDELPNRMLNVKIQQTGLLKSPQWIGMIQKILVYRNV